MMSYSNSLRFREAGSLISFTVTELQDYSPLLASPHGHHRCSAAFGRGDRTLGNRFGRATGSTDGSRVYDLPPPWVALFAQPTESLLTAAGIFAWDHPHIARQRFAVIKSRRVT